MALKYPCSGPLVGGHIPAKNGTMDDPLGTMGPLGPMVGVPVGNGGSSHQNNAATRVKRQNHLLISLLMLSMLLLVIALISGAVIYLHYLPYKKRPAIEEKPCEKTYCAYGSYCLVDEETQQARCQCQEDCAADVFAPVCGSDGATYASECQLRLNSCRKQKRIFARHQGSCDLKNPCQDKACNFGAECRPSLDGSTSECVCPERCATYGDSRGSRPVCGSDGQDYPNICELRRSACKDMKDLYVKYQGRCDPCEGVECPASQVCQLDDSRNPICRCNAGCTEDVKPVCGSDGKTYSNECTLRVEACKSRRNLRIVYNGECSTGANPCESLKCGPGQECDIDKYGIATCQCPATCEPIMRPVCASDGKTYDNECELRRQGCTFKKSVHPFHPGVCGEEGPCHGHACHFGAICILRQGKPICECPTCSEEFQPVCGTDGISYTNDCKMRKEACEKKKEIKVHLPGLCNGCENKKCEFYSICERNSAGEVKCACPKSCVKLDQPLCGSDGNTYASECHLRVSSCENKVSITVTSRGPCDVCEKVHCKYGARCEDGDCVCPSDCPETFEPVCANDGTTYSNECEMKKSSCQQSQELNALFYGECEDAGGSGIESGSGTEKCDQKSCLFGGVCDYDTEGLTTCVCHFQCPTIKEPVCGSDEKLYDNECRLREEACRHQKQIKTWALNKCKDARIPSTPCDGEVPLVDPVTGQDYDCSHGRKNCPPNSYCHKTNSFAKCCREVALIKSCVDTVHGCCPDGKTAAQGPKHAGCPSVCQCNRLGSYGQTCDPVTLQCPCKPGVGGLRCDRCEAGFWGLHKISEGNIGCIPCTCNEHGSVRDDCEQMTGRCVCRHGIQGMKCDICPQGMELIAGGCTDESIARTVPGTCVHLTCLHGAVCREKDERAQCICDNVCMNGEHNQQTVCGSDGTTYGSECQLQLFSCRYQKTITVWAQGACQKGFNVAQAQPPPTVGPVRRSTIQKTSLGEASSVVAEVGKSTRELPDDLDNKLPENLFLSTVPTLVTPIEKRGPPVMEESPVETPAFSGHSFLEMEKLNANSRLSIELEFRTFSERGILLYNGQTPAGKGDFVSLAINDGHVEFRYNLGSGAVTLRSPQKLQVGKYHRLVAKRYLRDGLLSLDDKEDVSGRSQGMLKSLNLEENLYIGAVPTNNNGVFENIGVSSGFIGCIRRLRIGHKEIDLRYPMSKDIIQGNQIAECTRNPCSSLPCMNSATCLPTSVQSFTCICPEGFTGDACELKEEIGCKGDCDKMLPCKNSTRQDGKPCPEQSKRGLKTAALEDELYVPSFDGNSSYLKLSGLSRVGQALSLELWFLARSPDGVLLYNGQLKAKKVSSPPSTVGHSKGRARSPAGDFVSLNLAEGFLQFRYDLGSGFANLSSREPVEMNKWHKVKATRQKRHGTLIVDDQDIVLGESKAPMNELNLGLPLYLGGVPDWAEVNKDSGVVKSLDGAIQRLVINGEVTDNLLKSAVASRNIRRYEGDHPCRINPCLNGGTCVPQLENHVCKCHPHFMGPFCELGMGEMLGDRPVKFDGKTFFNLPNKITHKMGASANVDLAKEKWVEGQKENRISVRFRTMHAQGLLLWINKGATIRGDYLGLAINDGYVELSFNLGRQREVTKVRGVRKVNDGKWHTALVHRNKRLGILTVDDTSSVSMTSEQGATELNTDGIFWIGGSPVLPTGLPLAYYQGFVGCVDRLYLDGDPVNLLLAANGHRHKVRFCGDS